MPCNNKEETKAFEDGRMGRERLAFQSPNYNRLYDEGALHRTLMAYVKYASCQTITLGQLVKITRTAQRTLDNWYRNPRPQYRKRLNTLIAGAALRADKKCGNLVMCRIEELEGTGE